MSAKFGGVRKYATEYERLHAEFVRLYAHWVEYRAATFQSYAQQTESHRSAEATRLQRMNFDRLKYEADCEKRNIKAKQANELADQLLQGYDRGDAAAVTDFIEVCLGTSKWPAFMPTNFELHYDKESKELKVMQVLPGPDSVPMKREYTYRTASGAVTAINLTVAERKRVYRNLISSIAIRTLTEVFAYDSGAHILTVSYEGVVYGVDPTTGKDARITLVAIAIDRTRFAELQLERIEPEATIKHLGGVLSKSPLELQPASLGRGVRSLGS